MGAPGRGLAWSGTREAMVPKDPLDRGCHVSLEGLGVRLARFNKRVGKRILHMFSAKTKNFNRKEKQKLMRKRVNKGS